MKRITALFLLLLLVLTGCQGKTVIKSEDFRLSNTEFSYYYWSEFFYYQDVYQEYLQDTVDLSKPLDTQMYDETQTWQDFMTERTITMVEETMSLVFSAWDEGYEMTQEYEDALDDVIVNFTDAAMGQEYKNVDAYLQASYGKGADEDSFRQYLYCTHLASSYADELYTRSAPTEEQAQAYYDRNPGAYEEGGLEQATEDLHSENYNNAILEVLNTYTFTVNRDNIRITAPEGLYN